MLAKIKRNIQKYNESVNSFFEREINENTWTKSVDRCLKNF